MSHLYFNEESDYSEVNRWENEVLRSTILQARNWTYSRLSYRCIRCSIKIGNLDWCKCQKQPLKVFCEKMCSLKFRKIHRKTPGLRPLLKQRPWHRCFSVNFVKFLKTPFLHNNSRRLLLKCGYWKKNEAREIDCLCYWQMDAMLIASAKISEHKRSMSPPSFYWYLPDY